MAASTDPTQWFSEDEGEDPEYDAGSVDLTRDDSSGDSSGDDNGDTPNESSEDEDGTDTDSDCDVEPLEVAAAVRGAMEQPPGERKVVLKGKTYTLAAPQGQSKKPLIPVFSGNVPKECEQLNELFRVTDGKKYYRPVINESVVEFNTVSVKAIRGVVAAMLNEMPDDTRDVRVFCQEYTTEDVFKHLIGITEKKPVAEPPKAETKKTAEPLKAEPPKAEPPKAEPEKTAEEPTSEKEATPPKKKAPKRKAPAGEPKTAKKKRQAPGQTTLDASVVVRDKPAPKPEQPEAPAKAPAQPSAAYAARLQVSSIIRAKLGEITTLLDFLEKNEKTRAAERELGL